MTNPATLLRAAFDEAVAAADPMRCLGPFLPERPRGRLVVLGAGKGAASMARAVEAHYGAPLEGLVVTRYGHALPTQWIEVVEASHPVPDAAGLEAAQRCLEIAQGLGPDDLLLALVSGGGSALLTLPLPGIALTEIQTLYRALLGSGATINEFNCVRRHLSRTQGGRLAAAAFPARVVGLLMSDVPGDDPAAIASGPVVADPSTSAEAAAILAHYRIEVPPSVAAALASAGSESVKPGDSRLATAEVHMTVTPQVSLDAAARLIAAEGLPAHILSDRLEGEARDAGAVLASIARQVAARGEPFTAPCVLLSGGETTVTLRANQEAGRGGRNVEFLLAFGLAAQDHPGIYALAADTDGIDGVEEIAGAIWTPGTSARAVALGLDPRAYLARHDGHGFFEALGQSIVTGPTHTNVNDFRAIYIAPPG
ncbi:glycerate kinase [Acidocella sp.]|uniref:glycerate kinase type-2 family protein n=1 Tax=Acidocella sp. TaxID=50710 RepID=UPI00260D92A4|nr:glycerate kinase [Acidocella sp.]